MMDFDQILDMHWYWQDLGWDSLRVNFYKFIKSYGPRLMPVFRFGSIRKKNDGILPHFAYALILPDKILDEIVTCHKFITELWPLIDVSILFPINILRTNWWNLTKLCIWFIIEKI